VFPVNVQLVTVGEDEEVLYIPPPPLLEDAPVAVLPVNVQLVTTGEE
jgi:hypothetical protein